MQLSVIEGAGVRRMGPTSVVPENAIAWWDLLPGDELPASVDSDLIDSVSHPTLVPSCTVTPHGLAVVVHSLDHEGHLAQLGIVAREREVVTVHSAFNEAVSSDTLTRETASVEGALTTGRAEVENGRELAALILTELTATLRSLLEEAAARAGQMDRRVRDERIRNQEAFLHDLFEVRRDLSTIRNRLAQTTEVVEAAARHDPQAFGDLVDGLERLVRMCDGERDFFSGVIEYFEQRVSVKINFATERLALAAALLLPLSAISGILGMNTIVQDQTNVPLTVALLVVMAVMTIVLLVWAKRRGWW